MTTVIEMMVAMSTVGGHDGGDCHGNYSDVQMIMVYW